jgi:PhzF family phenazine biosynthesis protein
MAAVPLWQVDAFTDRPFSGNPAAVCLLDSQRDAEWMQAVAAEMNLSETAFLRPVGAEFELRWFTPTVEVDLCGHATLAAAHALWSRDDAALGDVIRFHTRSGVLTASRSRELIELDFPATPAVECSPPEGLLAAVGPHVQSSTLLVARTKFDAFLLLADAAVVRGLQPDFGRLGQIPSRGVIVTAASDDVRCDFISRFFAPAAGIDEDPVTGSAHCALGPFWSQRLGKSRVVGYQASARGGVVHVHDRGDRVTLGGQAVTVFEGRLV